ncbi:NYN domain-containing protein [Dialister sp.]|uniref:NYN domain-containing protein n=1 Tax=Dialister sp. TaxID=1955814 RepID=UPI002E80B2E0|nr:NYN domain-containing protein [Dialister sp.]MEE3452458.1 NYN domain-containing protein [Dialister sp.]
MRDLYLVDGYNVIFWMPDVFDRDDLESSRKKLIDLMQDYGAHNNIEVIVVFDGQGQSIKARKETITKSFSVVFTPSRMTADSYIEKESYVRRDEYRHIFVVTSDGAEQSQVLGNGAYRVAVADLFRAMNEDKKAQNTFISHNNRANLRSEIGMAIPSSVQEKLNKLRTGK